MRVASTYTHIHTYVQWCACWASDQALFNIHTYIHTYIHTVVRMLGIDEGVKIKHYNRKLLTMSGRKDMKELGRSMRAVSFTTGSHMNPSGVRTYDLTKMKGHRDNPLFDSLGDRTYDLTKMKGHHDNPLFNSLGDRLVLLPQIADLRSPVTCMNQLYVQVSLCFCYTHMTLDHLSRA